MEYRKLGNTNIDVSVVCLGTMIFGSQVSEQDAHEQLDYAVSEGVNFIDTAEVYAVPPTKETQGLTEKYIGTWLKKRGKRDDLIIASKVVGPNSDIDWVRKDGQGCLLTKEDIFEAIDGSLERLQTDYIDLYQIHWPARETNYFGKRGYVHSGKDVSTSIEEQLEALSLLVKQEKVRFIGLSNETPWGVMEFLRIAKEKGLERVVSIQNQYSLLNRTFEIGLAEISVKEKVGLLAYSSLSMGVLSGKYLGGVYPEGARFHFTKRNEARYNPLHAQTAIEKYVSLAKENNLDPSQMALAYCFNKPFVTSVIIGARTMDQLKTAIDAHTIQLSDEVVKGIEEIYKVHPDPTV